MTSLFLRLDGWIFRQRSRTRQIISLLKLAAPPSLYSTKLRQGREITIVLRSHRTITDKNFRFQSFSGLALFVDMSETLKWNIGLVNAANKQYLTLETFGFKLNVNGVSLRKKQIWTLERDAGASTIYLRSHLGRYLSSDKKGNVSCEAEEKDNDTKFTIESQPDGKLALKNFYNEYLGGNDDLLRCLAKPSASEYWFIHLAMHPQVNLLHVKRDRYAHLTESGELRVSETIPWGADALVTLQFVDGKYALVTSTNKYLSRDGSLLDSANDDTLFSLELHDKLVAFRDSQGKYLTAVGPGNMQSKLGKVGQDEVFQLKDSPPQCSLVGHNDRRVSVKQGVDVTANQRGEIGDTEMFQFEFDSTSGKVAFRTSSDKYWVVDGGVTATGRSVSPKSQFDIEWHGNKIVLKSDGGKYITATSNGKLHEGATEPNDASYLRVELQNRPLLVLRQETGFVGSKGASGKLECGRANYSVFKLSGENGKYKIQAPSGKYWTTDSDVTISATADEASADSYSFELHPNSKLSIKAPNGNYLKGEQTGIFSAKGTAVDKSTLWEY